jgi:hypothetical protein
MFVESVLVEDPSSMLRCAMYTAVTVGSSRLAITRMHARARVRV